MKKRVFGIAIVAGLTACGQSADNSTANSAANPTAKAAPRPPKAVEILVVLHPRGECAVRPVMPPVVIAVGVEAAVVGVSPIAAIDVENQPAVAAATAVMTSAGTTAERRGCRDRP